MVSPFMDGGTLAERLGRPWPIADAVSVLEPLASALDHAHGEGVDHRDVKPSNVLFSERGRLVLGDFGVARMLEATTMLSAAGVVIGTPSYMAPEQAEGLPAGPASDLYALGVVAYQMLTGQVPFEAETPLSVLRAHVDKPLPPARSINASLSPELEAALFKALAKDPAARYPSGAAFAAAMARAGRSDPDSAPTVLDSTDATTAILAGAPAVPPVEDRTTTEPRRPPSRPEGSIGVRSAVPLNQPTVPATRGVTRRRRGWLIVLGVAVLVLVGRASTRRAASRPCRSRPRRQHGPSGRSRGPRRSPWCRQRSFRRRQPLT